MKNKLKQFYFFLANHRKKVFIPAAIAAFTGSYFANDWWRVKVIFLGFLFIVLLKHIMWELPEMLWNYFTNRATPNIKQQRRFDNTVLPALISAICLLFIVIIICIVILITGSNTYYPHWKSDINNMYANKFLQLIVDTFFPVKQYYSTLK